jgi:hypothetical protein
VKPDPTTSTMGESSGGPCLTPGTILVVRTCSVAETVVTARGVKRRVNVQVSWEGSSWPTAGQVDGPSRVKTPVAAGPVWRSMPSNRTGTSDGFKT